MNKKFNKEGCACLVWDCTTKSSPLETGWKRCTAVLQTASSERQAWSEPACCHSVNTASNQNNKSKDAAQSCREFHHSDRHDQNQRTLTVQLLGSRDSLLAKRQIHDRKIASLNPAGVAGEFSSPELTLCADFYLVSVPPPGLPQWHVKDPGHSAKSAGDRLHLNTHTTLLRNVNRSHLIMFEVFKSCSLCNDVFKSPLNIWTELLVT